MARPRATDTAEFKLQAGKLVTDQKPSVAAAARRPGVGENLRRLWTEALPDPGPAAGPRPARPATACGPTSPA